jgi:hypothetical protein
VYVRTVLVPVVDEVQSTGKSAHISGNGGLVIKLGVRGTLLCFVSCNLAGEATTQSTAERPVSPPLGTVAGTAADQTAAAKIERAAMRATSLAARNADAIAIIGGSVAIGRPDLDLASQFDHTFCMGSLSYQLDMKRVKWFPNKATAEEERTILTRTLEQLRGTDHNHKEAVVTLRAADELRAAQDSADAFVGWENVVPTFMPTSKVARGKTEEEYGADITDQLPSYTDRVLWKSLPGLKNHIDQHAYESCCGYTSSDHKPVRAGFRLSESPKRPSTAPTPFQLERVLFELTDVQANLRDPVAGTAKLGMTLFTDPTGMLLPTTAISASAAASGRKHMRRKLSWAQTVPPTTGQSDYAVMEAARDYKMKTATTWSPGPGAPTPGGANPSWNQEVLLAPARLVSSADMTTAYMHIVCSDVSKPTGAPGASLGSATIQLRDVYTAAENGWPYRFTLPLVGSGRAMGTVSGALGIYYVRINVVGILLVVPEDAIGIRNAAGVEV